MKNHTTENLNLDTDVEFTWSQYTQSEEYQVDKEYILRMIDNNPSYFKTLSDEWRADINIASFAIEKTPYLLKQLEAIKILYLRPFNKMVFL